MYEFKQLALLLQKELQFQHALEELLAGERLAIVKLNNSRLELIAKEKEAILTQASQVAERRDALLAKLFAQQKIENPRTLTALLSSFTSDKQLRGELESLTGSLRLISKRVQERNEHNSQLIRQTLGIVTSTISIFRSAVSNELPTYQKTGALRNGDKDVSAGNGLVSRAV